MTDSYQSKGIFDTALTSFSCMLINDHQKKDKNPIQLSITVLNKIIHNTAAAGRRSRFSHLPFDLASNSRRNASFKMSCPLVH